ncbi:MAG: type I 3-dehydroquinate dehydratase [Thermoplasmatota archaeon]
MANHLRIATLAGPAIHGQATRGHPDADLLEVRLDGLWPTVPTPERAARDVEGFAAAPLPLVATLRPTRQGGSFSGDEAIRLNLLAGAAACGFAYADVELDSLLPAVMAHLRNGGTKILLSEHLESTPTREQALQSLQAMQDQQETVEKLAFPVASFADACRAIDICRAHAERHGRPAVTPLGGGASLRALLAVVGNHATYGHAGTPAAPGQPALADVAATWRHWGLDANDLAGPEGPRPWLAVVGSDVSKSQSPRLQNAALRADGRRERMVAWDVPASAAALRIALMVAVRSGLVGASVTMPHKVDLIRIAEPDALARAVGAGNCLRARGGRLEATNTDASALRRILAGHLDKGAPCVVIGAGGAARAALWAARDLGASLHFTSRDPERAREVAAATGATWTPWDKRSRLSGQAWVQATPIDPALEARQWRGRPVVVELCYPGPTALERDAAAAGATVVGGLAVLAEQAADSYEYWFGARPGAGAAVTP